MVGRAQDVRIGTELPSVEGSENLRPGATPPGEEPPAGLKQWLANYATGVDTWSRRPGSAERIQRGTFGQAAVQYQRRSTRRISQLITG
jgi:hypothetical protein